MNPKLNMTTEERAGDKRVWVDIKKITNSHWKL